MRRATLSDRSRRGAGQDRQGRPCPIDPALLAMTPSLGAVPGRGRPLAQASDHRLVDMARDGSARAFEEIMRRYGASCGPTARVRRRRPRRGRGPADLPAGLSRAARREPAGDRAARRGSTGSRTTARSTCCARARPNHEQLDLESDGVPQPPPCSSRRRRSGGLVARMQDAARRSTSGARAARARGTQLRGDLRRAGPLRARASGS